MLVDEIRREGPIAFSRFMAVALYGDGVGFFARGGGSGRRDRDFVTSPEVGPLFGACVARALDVSWRDAGVPDPFIVVEAGAGNGRLAREILRAEPECSSALRYLLVETSEVLADAQHELLSLEPADESLGAVLRGEDDEPKAVGGRGPIVSALSDLPARFDGVLLANELIDNLVVDIAVFDGEWHEVRIGWDGERFVESRVPLETAPAAFSAAPPGARVPLPVGASEWLTRAGGSLRPRGRLILIDYVIDAATLLTRGEDWLRGYRAHGREDVLLAPGATDITADVVREQLVTAASAAGFSLAGDVAQSEWLAALGIDELVAQGAQAWREGAARGDLEAIAGRSRAVEAAALTDATGLGAFRVLEFDR